jgi:hypothetical protein
MELFRDLLPVPALFVAILLLYSGIGKLGARPAFRQSLLLIPFLPRQVARAGATAIPATELLVGALLFWNVAAAKIAAIALLCAFSLVAMLAVSRKQRVPCNCFGTDSSEFLSRATVLRNTALVAAVAVSFDVPAGAPELLAVVYALVTFILFLGVLKTIENRRRYLQLHEGLEP